MIIGSQKALALPPGLAILILSEKAITRIKNNKVNSLYFDLKIALKITKMDKHHLHQLFQSYCNCMKD